MKTDLSPDEVLAALRAHTEVQPFQDCPKERLFCGKICWREGRFTIRSATRRGYRGFFVGEYYGTVTAAEGGSVIETVISRKKWDYILLAAFLLTPWVNAYLNSSSLQTALRVFGLALFLGLGFFWFFFLNDIKETRIELHRIWYAQDIED